MRDGVVVVALDDAAGDVVFFCFFGGGEEIKVRRHVVVLEFEFGQVAGRFVLQWLVVVEGQSRFAL